MEPKVRMWIDARQEKLQPGRHLEVTYIIPNLETPVIRETVYYTLAALVKEIQLPREDQANMVKIIYDPERITPSFMDYLLLQRGIEFRRLSP
ncbi:Uncharacterized [Moorella glycerini]|uniref:Uncharacterized protein n=1 Tax=Neomoorella stamsii TaxID=1266720 RepID=A0A9X7J3D1_9FIRM|nr:MULTISPECIES: hypothetical protein [Moorella]PRR72970.1 hypothetical protein MOST_15150 [Moorella stamsii]CEP67641.1 Uncharacterized [Moorella glycerini]